MSILQRLTEKARTNLQAIHLPYHSVAPTQSMCNINLSLLDVKGYSPTNKQEMAGSLGGNQAQWCYLSGMLIVAKYYLIVPGICPSFHF